MGCCPSNSFEQSSPPLQTSSLTSALFPCSPGFPPNDQPPPYSLQPLTGHKSLTAVPNSDTLIPLRGWGESIQGPISAWGPANQPPEARREQQRLQSQVQFLQRFISILQQESAGDRVNTLDSIQPVESLGDLDEVDRLPPLSTQQHVPPLTFPMSPCVVSFPPAPITPHFSVTPISSNPLRLPPLVPDPTAAGDSNDPEMGPAPYSPHIHRSHERKKRKKRRRRRASVTPAPLLSEYPVLTLQRPFTSPNLRATLASPLGANQTEF